jgi:uroporphyrinogen decarboxylase
MTDPNSLMMRAVRGEAVERPPVWIMRQAGRYMAEYQAIRKEISFLDLCKDPVKAAEVTMLPMDMLDVDAAIVFSDILVPVEAMGLEVVFGSGGPRITNPVATLDDVLRLHIPEPAKDCPWPDSPAPPSPSRRT